MVESLITEAEWADALSAVPEWNVPYTSMLVVAPHPDDESLGAGGLISVARARGIPVFVAAVTDGERAYPEYSSGQMARLREVRIEEQVRALEILGVDRNSITRFALPDSAVGSHGEELVDLLIRLVQSKAIGHIVAPWRGDFHPDHHACGTAASEAARRTGSRLTSYFFWTWHQGSIDEVRGLELKKLSLTPAIVEIKANAIDCHQSQLKREAGEPILPEHLLTPALRRYETFLVTDECI